MLANPRKEIRAAKEALYDIAAHDAEGFEALARRAEEINDQELAGFFREVREENRRAETANELLGRKVAK